MHNKGDKIMNLKHKLPVLIMILLFAMNVSATNISGGKAAYEGSFFKVEYPKNFTAKPTEPVSRYNINWDEQSLPPKYIESVKTDEAYFTSPDGSVEFFVYSPPPPFALNEEPKNYLIVKPNEKIFSKDRKESSVRNKHVITVWTTIKDKNNKYYRSYVRQRACALDAKGEIAFCESHIFGIRYKNKKAYDKYRDDYIEFKKSLVQVTGD